MYISDYGYASKTSAWATATNTYIRSSGNDWLYNGITEWTITPGSADNGGAFQVRDNGPAYSTSVNAGGTARPVLYLKSNVKVTNGNGSKTNPYYISLN